MVTICIYTTKSYQIIIWNIQLAVAHMIAAPISSFYRFQVLPFSPATGRKVPRSAYFKVTWRPHGTCEWRIVTTWGAHDLAGKSSWIHQKSVHQCIVKWSCSVRFAVTCIIYIYVYIYVYIYMSISLSLSVHASYKYIVIHIYYIQIHIWPARTGPK